MRIGFHVSISKEFPKAVERATRLHCQTMQIFSGNPRRWQISKTSPEEIQDFKKKRKEAKIYPLFVHIPYLINLASPDKEIWGKSIKFFIQDLKFSELIDADYIVTHIGSHKGKGEEIGVKRVIMALNMAIKNAKTQTKVLLENTAGQGKSLGYKFWQIKEIIDGIKNKGRTGICLDTAHAFQAGYKMNTKKGIEMLVNELEKLDLLEKLKLIHLNDSRTSLGSRVDRHANIGKGKMGLDGCRLILNHPKFKKFPFIMETPRKSDKDDLKNLNTVLSLIY